MSKEATLRLARDPNLLGYLGLSLLYIKELCCDKQIIFVPLGLSLAISMTFVFAISDFLESGTLGLRGRGRIRKSVPALKIRRKLNFYIPSWNFSSIRGSRVRGDRLDGCYSPWWQLTNCMLEETCAVDRKIRGESDNCSQGGPAPHSKSVYFRIS